MLRRQTTTSTLTHSDMHLPSFTPTHTTAIVQTHTSYPAMYNFQCHQRPGPFISCVCGVGGQRFLELVKVKVQAFSFSCHISYHRHYMTAILWLWRKTNKLCACLTAVKCCLTSHRTTNENLTSHRTTSKNNQMGWPNEQSTRLPCWKIRESEPRGFKSRPCRFEPWSSQINGFKIDTCHLLAKHSALLGQGKDQLAQCQDNVTEWDTRSWC